MTTPWKPAGEWAGETVAVLAGGPSMTEQLAERLRAHRTIAVNHAHRMAPWADMLLALDGNWPQAWREFPGMRVTGVKDDTLDALYVGQMFEMVTLRAGHVVLIRNSGLAAIRVAARMGSAQIILAGFEPEKWTPSFEGEPNPYVGVAEGLEAIRAELRGVIVERL